MFAFFFPEQSDDGVCTEESTVGQIKGMILLPANLIERNLIENGETKKGTAKAVPNSGNIAAWVLVGLTLLLVVLAVLQLLATGGVFIF